jgi:outer membrane protein TolC
VAAAWKENLGLGRESLDVDTARARLEAARGALRPRLDFQAQYAVAEGGRTIDIPVGDLLNPVYSSLNQLLGSNQFAPVSNQSIPFLLPKDQQTDLRLLQPLYNPEIARQVEAARATAAGREALRAVFRRELRLDVERSYYRWLQAGRAMQVFASAQELVDEAERVNRSLVANGTAMDDALLRATAEVESVRQQSISAGTDRDLAASYLNFLLNRSPDSRIEEVPPDELEAMSRRVRDFAAGPFAAGRREELEALDAGARATEAGEGAARAAGGPTLSVAVESGIQGESYSTDSAARYTEAALVGQWNLFDAGQNRSRVREAANARRKIASETAETVRQIELQDRDARRRLAAAIASLNAAESRLTAARGAFAIVARREREGLVNQLGFLDARNALTAAEINQTAAQAGMFVAYAELDRSLALTPLP